MSFALLLFNNTDMETVSFHFSYLTIHTLQYFYTMKYFQLGLTSLMSIERGYVLIESCPELCFYDTVILVLIFY